MSIIEVIKVNPRAGSLKSSPLKAITEQVDDLPPPGKINPTGTIQMVAAYGLTA